MAVIILPKSTWDLTATTSSSAVIGDQRVLFIGQQVTDSSDDGVLVKDIGSSGEEDSLFGEQCILSEAIRQFRAINSTTTIDAIPYNDDGSAVAATGSIAFTGTATEDGVLTLYVQSKTKYALSLTIPSGATANDLASDFTDLINAESDILATAVFNSGVDSTDLTAVNGGTQLNTLGLWMEGSVSGLAFDITGMNGGATDPDISNFSAQVSNIRYQSVLAPLFGLSDVKSFLDGRFNSTGVVLDGVSFMGQTSDSTTVQATALSMNSGSMLLLVNKSVSKTDDAGNTFYAGSSLFELDMSLCAQDVAIRTKRFTKDQNIARYLVGSAGSGNSFGGPWLAGVPYQNTPFSNLEVIESEYGWTSDEQEDLNNNGCMFLGNNASLTSIISGQAITTYTTNTLGQSDTSFKFLNTVDTGSVIREFYYNSNLTEYAQAVMTTGDIIPNAKQVNPSAFTAFQVGLYSTLANDSNYALAQAGSDALSFYKENLTVAFDLTTGTITTTMDVPIVSQVRTIDGTVNITFDTTTS